MTMVIASIQNVFIITGYFLRAGLGSKETEFIMHNFSFSGVRDRIKRVEGSSEKKVLF